MALKTDYLFSDKSSCSCTMAGARHAAAFCDGCVVIFHGPKGCAQVASALELGSRLRAVRDGYAQSVSPVPMISTDMRERESIFGGTELLRECIAYAVSRYSPKCLIIASSCVAGITGDDIEAEAAEAEKKYSIPAVAVSGGGFLGGEFIDGYIEAAKAMADRFFRPCEKVRGRVLLLGSQSGPQGNYASGVKAVLSRFSLDAEYQYPGYIPFDELKYAAGCELISILGGTGESNEALEEMAFGFCEKYGMKILSRFYPVGRDGTEKWIREVAAYTGQIELGEAIISELEKAQDDYAASILPITRGKKVLLGIGRSPARHDPSKIALVLKKLETDVTAVTFDNLTENEKSRVRELLPDVPFVTSAEADKFADRADIIVTTHPIRNTAAKQIFIPMISSFGMNGETDIMRGIYKSLCSRKAGGSVRYV